VEACGSQHDDQQKNQEVAFAAARTHSNFRGGVFHSVQDLNEYLAMRSSEFIRQNFDEKRLELPGLFRAKAGR
jgi:hypothetical protein